MCQLIEVTWFIWKLSADQLIILLDRDQCSVSYFLASLGSEYRKTDTHIGHQCCDQLTAVKTRYPMTSITRLYRGLRCRPIEVKYFFEVIRGQGTGFQMIAGSSLFFKKIHMKCVVFMCRTIKILISNWPRTRKFSRLLQAGKTVPFDFSRHVHALVTLYVQFLCSNWSKFDKWVHAENLCSILNLVYFDSWSWQSFVSACDVFNFLFPLDVQNEIQLLSGVFCYSWLVCLFGFWLSESWKSDFAWHRFRFHLA